MPTADEIDAGRRPRETEGRVGLAELLGFAALLGALCGALFASWDVFRHARHASSADLLLALVLGVLPAVAVSLLLALALFLALRSFGYRPSRVQWVGLLTAVAAPVLVASIALLATHDDGGWRGVCLILVAILAGAFVFAVTTRMPSLALRGRPHVWALAAILAVLLLVGGTGLLRARGASGVLFLLPWVLALGAFLLAAGTSRRRPGKTAVFVGATVAGVLVALALTPRNAGLREVPARPARSQGPPNVVLIVLDTTRRDVLGCYGHPGGLTPVLDSVAAEGVVYDGVFSPSHWTVPSHASMFTGVHPMTHGCSRANRLWLDDEQVTLAERLRDRGYDTAAFVTNPWLLHRNMLQGFDTRIGVLDRYRDLAVRDLCGGLGIPAHWVDKGAGEACFELERWLAEREPSPFFLFVNLLESHAPYLPPREERLAHLPEGVGFAEATRFAHGFLSRLHHLGRRRDPYAQRIVHGMYEAEVRYQDRRLGQLLSTLRQHVDMDDTLVIVTSDHGENLGDEGRWDHEFDTNDALIHVPLVVRYPKRFPPGTRVSGLCELVDLVPTVLAVVDGGGGEAASSGRSLVPADFTPLDAVYAQMYPLYSDLEEAVWAGIGREPGVLRHFHAYWRMLRTEDWKLIWSSDGRHQLYDLRADPGEANNLYSEGSATADRLQARLEAWWENQPAYTPSAEPGLVPVGGEHLEQLRSLGYIR